VNTFEVQPDALHVGDDPAAAQNRPDSILQNSGPQHVSPRHILRALASDQKYVAAPHKAIAHLRPIVQAERTRAEDPSIGASAHIVPTNWSRFVDGTVIGLSHFARVCCDRRPRTMIAPVAIIAAGRLGRSELCSSDPLDLVFLTPNDKPARVQAKRITTFTRQALIDLGFVVDHIAVSSARCAQIVNATIAATYAPCELRFLWGHFALYSRFTELLDRATIRLLALDKEKQHG